VVSTLQRKVGRELARQRWQYLSVGLTVFLGLALFAASYDAFLNLENSYRQTYDRLRFADLTISGGDQADLADRARGHAGVSAVATRREAEIGLRIGGDHTLLGRIVEVPDSGRPALNRLDVLTGARPQPADPPQVLVERHLADHFGLEPGSSLEVAAADGWKPVTMAGSVVSAEYIWPARSRQDVLTSADDFGVVFAPTSLFSTVTTDPVEQTLVRFGTDTDAIATAEQLTQEALRLGASSVQNRAEQPSNAALQEDVAGFAELSFLFPVLFLGAAAMATFILLGRVVRSQQAQIAVLRANGLSTAQIVGHYLSLALTVTVTAGLFGLLVGVVGGRLVTGFYTDAISVPDTVTDFHPSTLAVGIALAVLTGAAGSALPATTAAHTEPGAALRGLAPGGRGGRSLVERLVPAMRRLPARWRMVIRGIGRDRRRSLSTAIGVVLALTLILASWGMVDTVEILLDRQFNEVQQQDAQLYYDPTAGNRPAGDIIATLEDTPGVERAEEVGRGDVVLLANGQRYTTELLAFGPDTRMHGFGSAGSPGDGLIAGDSLRTLLGIEVGDNVEVTSGDARTSVSLPVVGFVDEPLGTFVYSSLDTTESLRSEGSPASFMVGFSDDADREMVRATLTSVPGVIAYVDSRSLYATAQSLLSLFYAFVGVMLGFGALMAFALIFNTATVTTVERSPELAAMRVNGASAGQLSRLLAGENLLLTTLSLVPGLAIGYWVSALFMDSFSSDLFDFGLQMRSRTMLFSAGAILAVSLLAQWPVARSVNALDIARVVRERSQ
jgi:putative ABC transport system permease protein